MSKVEFIKILPSCMMEERLYKQRQNAERILRRQRIMAKVADITATAFMLLAGSAFMMILIYSFLVVEV